MVIVPKELKELKAKVAALSKVNAAKKGLLPIPTSKY